MAVKVREEGPGPSGGMGWREVRRFRTAQLLLIHVERMAEDSPRWPWTKWWDGMERSEEVQDCSAPADSCGKDGRGQSKMALDSWLC